MNPFSLRKQPTEPDPEPVDDADEASDKADEEAPIGWTGALRTGVCGPSIWLAARTSSSTAWTIHSVTGWACVYYGGWLAAGIVTAWLLLVLAFTPKDYLDRLTAAIERRINPGQDNTETDDETPDEATEEAPVQDDPGAVLDAVRQAMAGGRGVLLTGLRGPLRAADTRAVRETLAGAGIRVREGVRTAAGNGPGVHQNDLPPVSPTLDAAPVDRVVPGQPANTNANNTPRVERREGMTIITDPADRHRTHTLKKP